MLGRMVDAKLALVEPAWIWGTVRPLLARADASFVNLECVIATSGSPFEPQRVFYFRAAPRAINALLAAGVDFVSVANNHALDYRAPALLEMIGRLDRARIAHAGAGRTLEQAARPALVRAGPLRVAVVGFADHFELYAASETRAGTNVIAIDTHGESFHRVRQALATARATHADLIVFSIHWGPNMRLVAPPEFRTFARAVLDAGADVFFGHSAHVFQGIELYRGKPILYDTGELVDDYAVDEALRNDQGLLFVLRARAGRTERVELVPLLIDDMQVNLARGRDFEEIFERVRRLSAPLGTRIERHGDRLLARAE
jgi:poly-gamma-glutamate synthesis protein (capsule biosynthesis protein)